MSNSNAKGDRRERELVNALDAAGFAVMRAPASGSATVRELPDVLTGDGEAFYAIEVKSSAGPPIYLDGEEIHALLFFARNFGAKPRVGVRFDREDWYFFHPGDLHVTDGGNYRVKREEAIADGTDFEEFVGHSARTTLEEAAANGDGVGEDGSVDGSDRSDGGGVRRRDRRRRDGRPNERADDGPSQTALDVLAAFERGDLTREEAALMLE